MEKDCFLNRVYCELVIVSDTLNPDQLTNELGVSPSRSFTREIHINQDIQVH